MKKLILVFLFILSHSILFSQVPYGINYQGRILDSQSNPVPDGTYQMIFTFWSHETSTDLKQYLEYSDIMTVSLTDGFFNVYLGVLGFPPDMQWENGMWLQVQFENTVYPRTKLAGVPFSFYSLKSSSSLGDFTVTKRIVKSNVEISGIDLSTLNDYSIIKVTAGIGALTMPSAPVNGQEITIINASSGAISFGSKDILIGEAGKFVYVGAWYPVN